MIQLLETTPTPQEILVEGVNPLRFAEKSCDYKTFDTNFNQAMASHR